MPKSLGDAVKNQTVRGGGQLQIPPEGAPHSYVCWSHCHWMWWEEVVTLTAFPLMNFLMVENNPLPPLVGGVSSSTSECLLLVRDGRLSRVGFDCWDALRILSLIVFAVTCKAVVERWQAQKEEMNTEVQSKKRMKANTQLLRWTNRLFQQSRISLWSVSICSGGLHFLPTSGCIQDPISLTSQWITAATAGFTSIFTIQKKKKKTLQDLTIHTHTLTTTLHY